MLSALTRSSWTAPVAYAHSGRIATYATTFTMALALFVVCIISPYIASSGGGGYVSKKPVGLADEDWNYDDPSTWPGMCK